MPPIIVYEEILPADRAVAPATAEYRDRAVLHANVLVDYAGNCFECFSTLAGNDTALVIRGYHADGPPLGEWRLPPPANFKIDDFGVFLSGSAILVLGAAHEISNAQDRRNIVYRDSLPGVAVPYPDGRLPVGAPTDLAQWQRDLQPPGDPAPIDYGQIERIVAAGNATLAALFGGSSVRAGLQEKVEDGVAALLTGDPARDPRLQPYRDALFAFHMNIGGQQMIKILVEFGVVAPAAVPVTGPHSWPRALPGWPWGAGG